LRAAVCALGNAPALEIATRGGAAVLGRDDIGQSRRFAADIVASTECRSATPASIDPVGGAPLLRAVAGRVEHDQRRGGRPGRQAMTADSALACRRAAAMAMRTAARR